VFFCAPRATRVDVDVDVRLQQKLVSVVVRSYKPPMRVF